MPPGAYSDETGREPRRARPDDGKAADLDEPEQRWRIDDRLALDPPDLSNRAQPSPGRVRGRQRWSAPGARHGNRRRRRARRRVRPAWRNSRAMRSSGTTSDDRQSLTINSIKSIEIFHRYRWRYRRWLSPPAAPTGRAEGNANDPSTSGHRAPSGARRGSRRSRGHAAAAADGAARRGGIGRADGRS